MQAFRYQNKYFTLGQILLSKGLKIPILQEEALTDEWISIKIRINNYLRITGALFESAIIDFD